VITKEEKGGRLKWWSVEGKRSDEKRRERRKTEVVECEEE
jgi:hypothetical protein